MTTKKKIELLYYLADREIETQSMEVFGNNLKGQEVNQMNIDILSIKEKLLHLDKLESLVSDIKAVLLKAGHWTLASHFLSCVKPTKKTQREEVIISVNKADIIDAIAKDEVVRTMSKKDIQAIMDALPGKLVTTINRTISEAIYERLYKTEAHVR